MTPAWPILSPLLVHIQTHLDQDLGLDSLARRAELSPYHLQRLFKAAVGETPKAYVQRLRLERGAFRALVQEASLLEIALDCGFHNHETFTRAFRRRFGQPPSAWRDWSRAQTATWEPDPSQLPGPAFEISATKVVELRPVHLAFRRHVGPYEAVPESLFEGLERWAAGRRLAGPPIWMGIGHDAPVTTPAEQLRFDAALVVPGPFEPDGDIGYQKLDGGSFAVTTHAGPYETLPAAYGAIFQRVMALPRWRLIGVPTVEIYHTARVNPRYGLNHTDICLPVARAG